MITQENIKDITVRVEKLRKYLNIDQKLIEITNEVRTLEANNFM